MLNIGSKIIVVGKIIGDSFYMVRNRDKHFYRKYSGYAINKRILDRLNNLGIKKIYLKEADTDTEFMIPLDAFIENAIPIEWNGEIQYCVPLEYWIKTNESLDKYI